MPNASVPRNLLKVQDEDFNGKEALSISPASQVCVTQGPAHPQTPSVPDRKKSALHGNHSSSLEDSWCLQLPDTRTRGPLTAPSAGVIKGTGRSLRSMTFDLEQSLEIL